LQKLRLKRVVISETTLASGALIGLNQLWYADYPHSKLHSVNDNDEWLQMDKAGHLFSSYHLGRFGAEALQWSGCSKKSQLVYGATIGLAFMSTVEFLMDFRRNGDFLSEICWPILQEQLCMFLKNCAGKNNE